MALLEVKGLKTSFYTHLGEVQAVRGIDFEVYRGSTLGIVGESGSGKSVTALSVLGLLQHPGKIKEGEILFKGQDLAKASKEQMRKIRGQEIAMIFQDPMTSLNPVYTVGNQIQEAIQEHQKVSSAEAKSRAIELLRQVEISSPEERLKQYPHEFSGGMRQRVMIAMALSCTPELIFADEPTTALDVTIQAQIMRLLKDVQTQMNTAVVLITHDLGVVADFCERIIVLYGGMIMEAGTANEIFYSPKHPYTMGLLQSIPKVSDDDHKKLKPILGTPPDLIYPPKGCPFAPRCDYAMGICMEYVPPYTSTGDHRCMCWMQDPKAPKNPLYEEGRKGVRANV